MAYNYRPRGFRRKSISKIGAASEYEVFMISSSGNCGWCKLDNDLVYINQVDNDADPFLFDDKHIDFVLDYLYEENLKRIIPEEQKAIIKSYDMEWIDRGTYRDFNGVYFDKCIFSSDYNNVNFENCIFNRTCSMEDAEFINCNFKNAKMYSESILDTKFIHNNFANADFTNLRIKDCILDTNIFEEANFYNVGLNGTVVKDNSFLLTTVQNSYLHHIEACGRNRHVDTIRFHFGGATGDEFEKARNEFIKELAPELPENITDIPLREIDWNKVEEIYAYESGHNIPSDNRVTEWFGDYGLAVPKSRVSIIQFEHRYEDAKYNLPWNENEEAMERAIENALNSNVTEETMNIIMD